MLLHSPHVEWGLPMPWQLSTDAVAFEKYCQCNDSWLLNLPCSKVTDEIKSSATCQIDWYYNQHIILLQNLSNCTMLGMVKATLCQGPTNKSNTLQRALPSINWGGKPSGSMHFLFQYNYTCDHEGWKVRSLVMWVSTQFSLWHEVYIYGKYLHLHLPSSHIPVSPLV